MKKNSRFASLLLCLLLLFSLCACGKETEAEDGGSYAAPASAASYSRSAGVLAAETEDSFAVGGFAASSSSSANAASEETSETGDASGELDPEKIIYSASATIETTEFDATLEALQTMIDRCGGWVESSSTNGANYSSISAGRKTYRSASYTLRVPKESFSGLMGSLSELGNVPYSHVDSENVTSQYVDTQTRLATYEAQEQRLVELLDRAETVSDVIEIENELTEVRYRIESLQTTLLSWDRRVTWSTIELSINEVFEYTPAAKVGYGTKLLNALQNGIDTLGDFLIGLVEALPTLLVLAVLVFALVRLIRAAFRKRPARKEKKPGKEQTE